MIKIEHLTKSNLVRLEMHKKPLLYILTGLALFSCRQTDIESGGPLPQPPTGDSIDHALPGEDSDDRYPDGWKAMEIESKWEIDPQLYEDLISLYEDGSHQHGYEVSVRWQGIPRRFFDVYYDTPSGVLAASSHSLRHRTRSTSSPRATNGTLEALSSASWADDWERVQYKSTPCRIGATWFRTESGDCRIKDSDGGELCPGAPMSGPEVIAGELPAHPAITALRREHPEIDLSALLPVTQVTDYRYRVRFGINGLDVFELSLDRLETLDVRTRVVVASSEAELELLVEAPKRSDVEMLLSLSEELQREFQLQPSTLSKGGVPVSNCN